jgi:hypothetical protein
LFIGGLQQLPIMLTIQAGLAERGERMMQEAAEGRDASLVESRRGSISSGFCVATRLLDGGPAMAEVAAAKLAEDVPSEPDGLLKIIDAPALN